MLFAQCVSSETWLEPAVTLHLRHHQYWVGRSPATLVSSVQTSGWDVRSLPNTSLSQNHQGGPAVFLLSHSVIAKAGETKPAHLPVSLDRNSAGYPDLMYIPECRTQGSSQVPEETNLHLSTAFWMCTRNFQLCDESGRVLLKEISEKSARRSRMRP